MLVMKALNFKEYTKNEKGQMAMSLPTEEALIWWISVEQKLHISSVIIPRFLQYLKYV